MRGGSLIKHKCNNGIIQIWEITSIEHGGQGEIGVVKMRSLSQKNTIDGEKTECVVPTNFLDTLRNSERFEIFNKAIR